MKGLVVILGGSFRLGTQGNTRIGVPESYAEQIEACNSHIRFIKDCKERAGMDLDVVIKTYHTPYDSDIKDIYAPYIPNPRKPHPTDPVRPTDLTQVTCFSYFMKKMHTKGFMEFLPEMIGINKLYENAADTIKPMLANYEFTLFIRIDLCLKPYFTDIFLQKYKSQQILFPSNCFHYNNYHITHNKNRRVSSILWFVPKSHYIAITEKTPLYSHEFIDSIIESKIIDPSNVGYMLPTLHDSDSYKDWNPLYYIVNRPQNKKWYSKGYVWDEEKKNISPSNITYDEN